MGSYCQKCCKTVQVNDNHLPPQNKKVEQSTARTCRKDKEQPQVEVKQPPSHIENKRQSEIKINHLDQQQSLNKPQQNSQNVYYQPIVHKSDPSKEEIQKRLKNSPQQDQNRAILEYPSLPREYIKQEQKDPQKSKNGNHSSVLYQSSASKKESYLKDIPNYDSHISSHKQSDINLSHEGNKRSSFAHEENKQSLLMSSKKYIQPETTMTKANLSSKQNWNRLQEIQGQNPKMLNLLGLITVQTSQGKKLIFTGFLMTANFVVSSAEAIYNRNLKKSQHKKVLFYPSLNGELQKIKPIQVEEIIVHERYIKEDEPNPDRYNISLIKLKNYVPSSTSINIKIPEKDTLRAYIYGYPKLENQNNLDEVNPQFYPSGGLGDLLILGDNCEYHMKTESGLSGSPIFTYVQGQNSVNVIGIHLGRGESESQSKGLILRKEILDRLVEWQYDLTGKTDLQLSSEYLKQSKALLVRTQKKITEIQGVKMSKFQ